MLFRSFEVIREWTKRGALFTAASGRQYPNLRKLFAPVADEIAYIAENGSFVKYHGETLYKSTIERQLGLELIHNIYARPNCDVTISGEDTLYIKPKKMEHYYGLRDVAHIEVTIVENFEDIPEDFMKISVFCEGGLTQELIDSLNAQFGSRLQSAVSGKEWFDFVNFGESKGKAFAILRNHLGIAREDTAAFGDNYNDVECLQEAGMAYVMANACEDMKQYGNAICTNVEETLRELLQ